MRIFFLATRWGSEFGGINTFNSGLCMAVGALSSPAYCLVEQATESEVAIAAGRGVALIVIGQALDQSETTLRRIADLTSALREKTQLCWVGHDLWTGAIAIECAVQLGGRSVVIHHMDFDAYAALKYADIDAEARGQSQGLMLRRADIAMAVGPVLTESVRRHGVDNVIELLPGFPNIEAQVRNDGPYEILVLGRVAREDDPIKQIQLSLTAIAEASHKFNLSPIDWRVKVIGAGAAADEYHSDLKRIIQEGSFSFLDVKILPYEADQSRLYDLIARSDLVLMPSLREGFGLVGWEAIAAGVPVILGQSSGVFRTLRRLHLGGLVASLDVRGRRAHLGQIDDQDVKTLSELVAKAFWNRLDSKGQALTLRQILVNNPSVSWRRTAQTFLEAIEQRVEPVQSNHRAPSRSYGKWSRSQLLRTIMQSDAWDAVSLRHLLSDWDLTDVDVCHQVGGILRAAVTPTSSLERLAYIHHTLTWLGLAPNRDSFFDQAGRRMTAPADLLSYSSVSAGHFTPGSPLTEKDRCDDEGFGRPTSVSSFRLTETTVTNSQFRMLDRDRPRYRWNNIAANELDDHPVINASWWEAYIYCVWIDGRLPTELEWEYACRAGTTSPFYIGNDARNSGINALDPSRHRATALNRTLPARSDLNPHPFGLHHMHGNVWEWCWSDYASDGFGGVHPSISDYSTFSPYKVARGGSWDAPIKGCRSAFRNRLRPNYRNNDLGFRVLIPGLLG